MGLKDSAFFLINFRKVITDFTTISVLFLLVISFCFICSCTSSESVIDFGNARMPGTGRAALRQIRTIGLVAPETKILELSASGNETVLGPETDSLKKNVTLLFKKSLENLNFSVKFLNTTGKDSLAMAEISAMYRNTENVILQKSLKATEKKFEFEVGSLDTLPRYFGVDALLFIRGFDSRSSSGRNTAQATALVVGAITGTTVILQNPSFLSIGIIYRNGKLVYFNFDRSVNKWNFSKKDDIEELSEILLKRLGNEL